MSENNMSIGFYQIVSATILRLLRFL